MLLEKFDLIFSLGVLEHTIDWGYPSSLYPVLAEMFAMLKTGGLLANIYEPMIYSDNPFNIRHDIAFLSGYLSLIDDSIRFPSSYAIPSMFEIAVNPDTMITDQEIILSDLKGRNSWTALDI